ncbi:MAG: hypothetical protein CMG57_09235 [Candidatus Marinimicrobia bacterium]|nr:hypothetical protein [Candidatus Neomarinimicrobiota bacterium]|tara:strand:+ start:48 stop:239 length:192 start_codon:yes stop_codon:yes gene_type:complete
MENIDWRLRILVGIILLIIAVGAIKLCLDMRTLESDYNKYAILAILAIWGGCDWLMKGIQDKT